MALSQLFREALDRDDLDPFELFRSLLPFKLLLEPPLLGNHSLVLHHFLELCRVFLLVFDLFQYQLLDLSLVVISGKLLCLLLSLLFSLLLGSEFGLASFINSFEFLL